MKSHYVLFPAILVSAAFAAIPGAAHAGAWIQNQGNFQWIPTIRAYTTSKFFDADGDKQSIEKFSKTEVSDYFEYGVSDYITLGGDVSVAAFSNDSPGIADMSHLQFSYGTIFARGYLYADQNMVVSIEPGVTFPSRLGEDIVSDGTNPIPELKLSFGYGFQSNGLNDFFDSSIKYRYRDDGQLDDMIKAEMTFGYRLSEDFMALAQVSHEQSLGSIDGSVTGNYMLTKPQLSVVYGAEKDMFHHQIGGFSNIYGENTGAGYGFFYSLWVSF